MGTPLFKKETFRKIYLNLTKLIDFNLFFRDAAKFRGFLKRPLVFHVDFPKLSQNFALIFDWKCQLKNIGIYSQNFFFFKQINLQTKMFAVRFQIKVSRFWEFLNPFFAIKNDAQILYERCYSNIWLNNIFGNIQLANFTLRIYFFHVMFAVINAAIKQLKKF